MIVNAKDSHAEGVVFINAMVPLGGGRPNRGGNNLRWKSAASCRVIVAEHNVFDSVEVALADGTRIGSVTMNGHAVPPVGTVIEVEYLYCQSALVQPVYKGIRTDVEPAACNRAQRAVNVGGFSQGQPSFLEFHRSSVLLRAIVGRSPSNVL